MLRNHRGVYYNRPCETMNVVRYNNHVHFIVIAISTSASVTSITRLP